MKFKYNSPIGNIIGRASKDSTWWVSYNPCTFDGHEETALCIEDSSAPFGLNYAILEGDFTKEYKACETLKDALKVYIAHCETNPNPWTTISKEDVMKKLEEK